VYVAFQLVVSIILYVAKLLVAKRSLNIFYDFKKIVKTLLNDRVKICARSFTLVSYI